MPKIYLYFAGLLLLVSPAAANADELVMPLTQCIHDNAPKVEQTVPSLADAASFLIDDVCAVEATAEVQRQREKKYKEMHERQLQQTACEAKAGGDANARAACITQNAETAFASLSQFFPIGTLPASKTLPEATSAAAKELLKLRISRADPGK